MIKLKKIGLFGLLFSLPLVLIACGPSASNSEQGDDITNLTAVAAPTDDQKINDNEYTYYYGQTCSYCKQVEDYLKESGVDLWITIVPKEVTLSHNATNRDEMLSIATALEIPLNKLGTPFIVITSPEGQRTPLVGADEALSHFKDLEAEIRHLSTTTELPQ